MSSAHRCRSANCRIDIYSEVFERETEGTPNSRYDASISRTITARLLSRSCTLSTPKRRDQKALAPQRKTRSASRQAMANKPSSNDYEVTRIDAAPKEIRTRLVNKAKVDVASRRRGRARRGSCACQRDLCCVRKALVNAADQAPNKIMMAAARPLLRGWPHGAEPKAHYLPRYRSASTNSENAGDGWRRLG